MNIVFLILGVAGLLSASNRVRPDVRYDCGRDTEMSSQEKHQIRRSAKRLLTVMVLVAVLTILEACSGNARVSTGVGIHRSSSGSWGHSISVGVHSHGRGW